MYIISISFSNERKYYVGRTGTSNGTGTSSPFKRLGTHLAKRGNTKSVFWENARELEDARFNEADIHFHALPVGLAEVGDAEKWLILWLLGNSVINK